MAIIFTSPKGKKRALFWGISAFLTFILAIVFFAVFPPEFKEQTKFASEDVTVPDLEVNLDILTSTKVNKLEPFLNIEPQTENIGRNEPFTPY